MLSRHRDREDEHEENRPKKAEGIFTAYRAIGYRKRLDAWELTRKQLHRRYLQLKERAGLAEAYQVDTASSFYLSKAEQLAEHIRQSQTQEKESKDMERQLRREPQQEHTEMQKAEEKERLREEILKRQKEQRQLEREEEEIDR